MPEYKSYMRWETPEELQRVIDGYFEDCAKLNEVPTVTGMAFALGTDRKTLIRYENNVEHEWLVRFDDEVRARYRHTIKRAKAFIESGYEQSLFKREKAVGAIFTLKNNYGYVDKTEQVIENKTIDIKLE